MSGSYSQSNSKSTTNSTSDSQSNPWAVTIPALTESVKQIEGLQGGTGATADQQAAIAAMKARAAEGNPWATDIGNVASGAFGAQSNAGMATDAYGNLQRNIGGYASGANLDFNSNPYIQNMLKTVGDDAANRINAQFAAAGRDMSGMNQNAVARGITQAEAPILMNEYNKQQENQLNAANQLYGAGVGTAQTAQGLDANALQTRAQGVGLADAALNAQNWGDQQRLQLDQLLKNIPVQNQQAILSLLGPIAGLGGQQHSTGTSTTKGSTSGFSAGASFM